MLNKLTARQVQQLNYLTVKGIKQDRGQVCQCCLNNVLIWEPARGISFIAKMLRPTRLSRSKGLASMFNKYQYLFCKGKKNHCSDGESAVHGTMYISSFFLHTFMWLRSVCHDVQVSIRILLVSSVVYVLTVILVPDHKFTLQIYSRSLLSRTITLPATTASAAWWANWWWLILIKWPTKFRQWWLQTAIQPFKKNLPDLRDARKINTPLTAIIFWVCQTDCSITVDETAKAETYAHIVEAPGPKELGD